MEKPKARNAKNIVIIGICRPGSSYCYDIPGSLFGVPITVFLIVWWALGSFLLFLSPVELEEA